MLKLRMLNAGIKIDKPGVLKVKKAERGFDFHLRGGKSDAGGCRLLNI